MSGHTCKAGRGKGFDAWGVPCEACKPIVGDDISPVKPGTYSYDSLTITVGGVELTGVLSVTYSPRINCRERTAARRAKQRWAKESRPRMIAPNEPQLWERVLELLRAYSNLNGRAQTWDILAGEPVSAAELDVAWKALHEAKSAWLVAAGWTAERACPVPPHREVKP